MKEADAVRRSTGGPVTRFSLERDLITLGVERGMTLLVHSSLSSLGWVCGGPVAVIYALEEVVRPYGNIVMPTHSGDLSDPSGWRHPPVPESWWHII
ncbi:MAG TPA: AAC(3) family N-acetyltransferase, partial [Spirochaetia bacterium]|nr:AAC(3) family N-acetyltransferase [Spirochaetia bacterium]